MVAGMPGSLRDHRNRNGSAFTPGDCAGKLHLRPDAEVGNDRSAMNRIEQRFAELRRQNRPGFIVYIGAGDPDLEASRQLAHAFEAAGVDVLELGVPFSDPLADGLVNQLAAQRGLQSGTTPDKVLATVARIRESSQLPIVLYIYYNLIHRRGIENFVQSAAEAGVDGLLVLDLPPEESGAYESLMRQYEMSVVYLVAPTTPPERIESIVRRGSGFIYYVSREGVTGMRAEIATGLAERISLIRRFTDLPIAVGFGISRPEHVAAVASVADAVVVGSAIVHQIAEHGRSPDLIERVTQVVRNLVDPIKKS